MSDAKKEIIIPPKYAPPYPQAFHRFWPTHAVKSGIVVAVTLAVIVVLSYLYRVPTDHNMPPLPDAGAYIPAPEWYLLFVFEPFWYLTEEQAIWRQVGAFWIPLAVFVFLLVLPFLFGRKKWSGSGLPTSSKVLIGLGALAFWVVLTAAVVGSGYRTKTTSCISCHTPMMDKRQALPPVDMAKHYREVREMEIALGRHRPGDAEGTSESYKDANWQLRHYAEPTEHW
jgi:quinol-cytochrome oxidoreductase complex cytochrome b subunit